MISASAAEDPPALECSRRVDVSNLSIDVISPQAEPLKASLVRHSLLHDVHPRFLMTIAAVELIVPFQFDHLVV